MTTERLGSSFRDPSGYLFTRDGVLYRQVNQSYAADYDRLMASGLYEKLVGVGLLIPHEETDILPENANNAYKILRPARVPFISYPYEWSFSQLREAALATLAIQRRAMKYGLSLKDASAYNLQFYNGRAALIDTLSFETYQEGEPWVAYRQFCQHFLAPLALMAKRDIRLGQLLRIHLDGIPLGLASALLPSSTKWNPGLLMHIHLHARSQARYAEVALEEVRAGRKMSPQALLGVINSLERVIRKLNWKNQRSEWGDYYEATNYSDSSFEYKQRQVADWSRRLEPSLVWDLGANTGIFSRLAVGPQGYVVASDIDPVAVEKNWRQVRRAKEKNILPLLLDLTNPSPAIGWGNQERASFLERGPADLVLALALVHHLAISNNLPLEHIANVFSRMGPWLIVEFIPKDDSQVQRLLRSRKDIFPDYTRQNFEVAFGNYYQIMESQPVAGSSRWLYLMKKGPSPE